MTTTATSGAIDPRAMRGGGPRLALAAMIAAWSTWSVWLCARKFRYFLYDDVDLGIFTQAVDRLLHGTLFNSIRGMNWLGDHSSLNLFLLAPLHALFPSPLTLLTVQSLALALGAIPCYALARRELGDERLALYVAALYLAYPALGYVSLFEFHPESLAVAPLLAAFLALRTQRPRACLAWSAVSLLAREDVALVVLAMAAYAVLATRGRARRTGAGLAALAVASLAVSFLWLKPHLSSGEAEYGRMYAAWGNSAWDIAGSIVRQPLRALSALISTPGDPFDSRSKLEFLLHLMLPVAFLPLAGGPALLVAVPTLAEHLLSSRGQQHSIVFQYTALMIPAVFVATVLGLRRLSMRDGALARDRAAALLGVALATTLLSQLLFGPVAGRRILLSRGPIERVEPQPLDRALVLHRARMLARIPPDAPVVAGFEYLARLARRDSLHSLHHVVGGRFTYSTRAYPQPVGIVALVADLASPRLTPFLDDSSSVRLARLLALNGLLPVDTANDQLLFLQDATPLPLVTILPLSDSAATVRASFEQRLTLCDSRLWNDRSRAGGTLEFSTDWRRIAPLKESVLVRWQLLDADGAIVHQQIHHLGYLVAPPTAWPEDRVIREWYRLVLPDVLRPGRYTLAMQVGWRRGREATIARLDQPTPGRTDDVLTLGTFEIEATP
ncbi:MAG: DUF2079 domain-containing protein [Candidatus Eisenbacteria bacterium]|uniref:DUF2079 domain-containing protein n=1 Tax=Eiseniibacteriota bacterium TaxID=2212470 RepID=A0A849SLH3_UNCEI|nr:DUF2079 domain-containing protein [Candidatus Eisenbacteria bacterium]